MSAINDKIINLFNKSATGSERLRKVLTPIGAIFYFGCIVLLFFLSLKLDEILEFPSFPPVPANYIISIPLLLVGLIFTMITGGKFIKAHGTPVPFNPPPTLVTGGLYSYVRNPMIAGNIFLLFGLGILVNSISVAFIFTPIFVLLHAMNLKFIEEPELERRFGDEYMDYKKRTPMFFPGFKKKDSMSSC